MSGKCLSEERISNARNSLGQAGLFQYQVHEWTKTLQKFSHIRLCINLCPRVNLQRHQNINLDRETCPDVCIHFFKPCGRTNFPLQLWSSSPRCIIYWTCWKLASQSEAKMKNLFLDIKTTTKIKLGSILEKLTQCHKRLKSAKFDMSQDDCDNEICASTHLLQIQKKSTNWSSRTSGLLLQSFTCVWFQQFKIRS